MKALQERCTACFVFAETGQYSDQEGKHPNMICIPKTDPTFQDVALWADVHRSKDDCSAVKRIERLWDNLPLAALRADLATFDKQFPLHGFDPAQHRSESAYKAWRRKVLSVLRAYPGAKTSQPQSGPVTLIPASDVKRQWDALIATAGRYAHDEADALFARQRLIPIVGLSRMATTLGLRPKDLRPQHLAKFGEGRTGAERAVQEPHC